MNAPIRPAEPTSAGYPGTQRPHSSAGASRRGQGPRLLPTLFDRLRDEAPSQRSEAPANYTLSPSQLRDIVQRDLSLLFNTINADDALDRERYPAAASSTVNFGMPALAGSYLSSRRWQEIERIIRRAIADFEPRLISDSVRVRPLLTAGAHDNYNVLLFEISALIDLQPYPLEFTVQSAMDLETNRIRVERSGPGGELTRDTR